MAAPLTPEEMKRFQAQFGLGQPQGPPPFQMVPPAAPPMQAPEVAPVVAPPPVAPSRDTFGLSLPAGIGSNAVVSMPALKPGQEIDTGAPVPFAPAPKLEGPAPPPAAPAGPPAPMQLSYPPIVTVPGGWQGQSRVVVPGRKVSDDTKDELYGSLDTRRDAVNMHQAAEEQRFRKEAETIGALADAHNDLMAKQAAKQSTRDALMQKAQARYTDAVSRAEQVADVNPNRFFAERGAGAQLMAIIGMTLGQIGASITGGPNSALAMIEGALDRDLAAQRTNIDKARGNVADVRGVLGEMRAQFGDERQAEAAAKDAMLGATELRLKQIAAGAGSEHARANAMDLLSQIQEKRGQLRKHFEEIEGEHVEKEVQKYTPAHTVGGPPGARPADKEEDSRMVTLDDGTTYQMRSPEDAKKIRAQLAGVRQIESLARDLDKVRGETSTYIPATKNNKDAESLGGQMLYAFKDTEQAGTVDDGLIRSFDKLIGDPTSMTSRAGQRALSYAERKRASINSALKANGARVVTEGYARDQAGHVVPTQAFAGKSVANALMPKSFQAVDGRPANAPAMPPVKAFDPDAVAVKLEERKKRAKK